MVTLLLQPLVCNDVLEWLFFVDIPITCENIHIILIFETINQVDDRTDRATRFKCWGIPITEYEKFLFDVQLFMVKLSFLNAIFLEPVT